MTIHFVSGKTLKLSRQVGTELFAKIESREKFSGTVAIRNPDNSLYSFIVLDHITHITR